MAASFNKVILVGNLTRDPEIRTSIRARRSRSFASRSIPTSATPSPKRRCTSTSSLGSASPRPAIPISRRAVRSRRGPSRRSAQYDDTKLRDDSGQPIRRQATEVVISDDADALLAPRRRRFGRPGRLQRRSRRRARRPRRRARREQRSATNSKTRYRSNASAGVFDA